MQNSIEKKSTIFEKEHILNNRNMVLKKIYQKLISQIILDIGTRNSNMCIPTYTHEMLIFPHTEW